jgi:hypothetical protein
VHPAEKGIKMMPRQRIFRGMMLVLFVAPLHSFAGCQYYEQNRVLKSTADVKEEQAKLLKAYRHCLEKYEAQPTDAKEHCAPYVQSFRELDMKHEK